MRTVQSMRPGPVASFRLLLLWPCHAAQGFPHWQVVVVDLRCHGESAAAAGGHAAVGPHTVETSARDVLNLLRELRMFPHMLVGHSFGGKVVMSMAHQFGARLPRPVQVCSTSNTSTSQFLLMLHWQWACMQPAHTVHCLASPTAAFVVGSVLTFTML